MIVAATGHRPDKLGGYDLLPRRALGALAVEHLHYNRPTSVIVGMALGWDQAVAAACVTLGIPFIAAVPFEGQESRWPEESQQRYFRLLGHAERVEVISEYPGSRAMELRNRWMVDHADEMLALWNGDLLGGTANCIRYAEQRGRPITNLWRRWVGPDEFDAVLG